MAAECSSASTKRSGGGNWSEVLSSPVALDQRRLGPQPGGVLRAPVPVVIGRSREPCLDFAGEERFDIVSIELAARTLGGRVAECARDVRTRVGGHGFGVVERG